MAPCCSSLSGKNVVEATVEIECIRDAAGWVPEEVGARFWLAVRAQRTKPMHDHVVVERGSLRPELVLSERSESK